MKHIIKIYQFLFALKFYFYYNLKKLKFKTKES